MGFGGPVSYKYTTKNIATIETEQEGHRTLALLREVDILSKLANSHICSAKATLETQQDDDEGVAYHSPTGRLPEHRTTGAS